jgi:hypothetical protein
VLVGGLATFLISAKSSHNHSIEPFVLTHSRYWKSSPEKKTQIVRIVNSEGKSLEKLLAPNGDDFKHAVVQHDPKDFSDRHTYVDSENFDRVEQLHGLTVYVFRQPIGEGEVIETWLSPKTGRIPLKQIIEKPNGDANITEVVSLEFKEVSDKDIAMRPELLVDLPSSLPSK